MKNKDLFIRKSLAILSFCFLATFANGQTEIKANPFAWIFQTFNISAEQIITEDWGIDADIYAGDVVDDSALYITLSGKYYFKPKIAADGFHIGLFTGLGADAGIGIGFLAGYKLISKKAILFEFGLGAGRAGDNMIPYFKLHAGYRFNTNSNTDGKKIPSN